VEDLNEEIKLELNPDLKEARRMAASVLGRISSEKKKSAGAKNLELARKQLEEIRKFKKERANEPS
jgi:hypothetical protein